MKRITLIAALLVFVGIAFLSLPATGATFGGYGPCVSTAGYGYGYGGYGYAPGNGGGGTFGWPGLASVGYGSRGLSAGVGLPGLVGVSGGFGRYGAGVGMSYGRGGYTGAGLYFR